MCLTELQHPDPVSKNYLSQTTTLSAQNSNTCIKAELNKRARENLANATDERQQKAAENILLKTHLLKCL